jgi:predicted nuclease of restriction endonuclease-like (RecB) superfamily
MKQQIRSVQAKAALAVNSSLIQLYWNMGRMIAENQALFEGRNSYVEQLAKDLRNEFPDISGFSRANLFFVRKFYRFYSVQQPVRLLEVLCKVPWGHHVLIINKVKETSEAIFYVQQTIEYNWSRAILTLQIEQNLYQRQGKAITNFTTTLSEKQALMAVQMLKDLK